MHGSGEDLGREGGGIYMRVEHQTYFRGVDLLGFWYDMILRGYRP